jgi:hypothetical protein
LRSIPVMQFWRLGFLAPPRSFPSGNCMQYPISNPHERIGMGDVDTKCRGYL